MLRPRPGLFGLLTITALLTTLVVAPPARAGTTLYVGPGGGSGGCASPAYTTIASAVAASGFGNTIHICSGTYNLAATVNVPWTITFVGDGAATTIIDGGGTVQLFDAHGRTVSFEGLTLRNGHATLGGAIWASAVTVTSSTLNGNSATLDGGAIEANTVSVADSTLSVNTAAFDGGAIGGGGTVTITNGTLSGNNGASPPAAIYALTGTTLSNTIVSGTGAQCSVGGTNGGGNLVTDASCPGTVVTATQLALGPLADNGGPTQTMALGITSAALNAGVDATCAASPVSGLDQRGVTRPQGTHCDAGAYELVGTAPAITSFSPVQGPLGTLLTIRGSGFTGASSAAVNGTPLTGMTVVNDATITGTVAPGTTSGKVTVATPFGTATSAGTFTVTLAPTVLGFSPLSGKVGATVTISGAGFAYARTVTIGGKSAIFSIRSPSTIVATVPAGAVTGKITVTSQFGSTTSATTFVVLP